MFLGKRIVGKTRIPLYTALLTLAVAVVSSSTVEAQEAVSSDELAAVRAAYYEQHRPTADAPLPVRSPLEYLGTATPANAVLRGSGGGRAPVDLYNGLPVGGFYWFWTGQPFSFWALDDGTMGPAAFAVGGGEITQYEFAFGLHADAVGDTLEPIIFITLWNAPLDPVADASNPVVDPPAPVSSVVVTFLPITLPGPGDYVLTSGLLDLAAAGLAFDLDETFYVEVFAAKLQGGVPVIDPNVFAVFSSGPIILGTNQDNMWIDVFPWGLMDGYDHPGDLDPGGGAGFEDQSPIHLIGNECPDATLELSINEPDDICVKPNEPVTVTLSQSCLPGLVRGYQAFLSFDTGALAFDSGSYIQPDPYDLPIITPITAVGGDIDVAAGIDDLNGQSPTSTTADLVTLNFTAGPTQGLTQVTFRTHAPPTRFSDLVGAELAPLTVDSPTICIDGTPPVIDCTGMNIDTNNDVGTCGAIVDPGVPAASDDGCGGLASVVGVRSDGLLLTDLYPAGCTPGTITAITWTATDCAGNTATCEQTIAVTDNTDPTITNCPSDIPVNADAGLCTASVTFGGAMATDNCGMHPTEAITYWIGGYGGTEISSPYIFSGGITTVTVVARDACDNVNDSCTFDVTVSAANELDVDVVLLGLSGFNGTRCITFELWNCPDDAIPAEIVPLELTFSSGAFSGIVEIPCGDYNCITARDTLHTLRRTDETFTIVGTQYVADFAGSDALSGGNLNDDFWIDILDFGVFTSQWNTNHGTGDTDCTTPFPHADISGDGLVFTEDYTFINVNFLTGHETNCCGAPLRVGGQEDGPITEISVRELHRLGLGHLTVADLNGDGSLDQGDIVAFMQGARPQPQPKPQPRPQPRPGSMLEINEVAGQADVGSAELLQAGNRSRR